MKPHWVLLVLGIGLGQTRAAAPEPPPAEEPTITVAPPAGLDLTAGVPDTLWFGLRVAEGIHVQANPAADSFLVPLTLELNPVQDFVFGPTIYPEPVRYRLNGATEDLLTCTGAVQIGIPIRARPGIIPGRRRLAATLKYQACSDRRCLAPDSLSIEFSVTVP